MIRGPNGAYEPVPHLLEDKIRTNPHLHDKEYAVKHFPTEDPSPLVLPDSSENHRVVYSIFEYDPVLDSSNMTMDDWIRIAIDIERLYDQFDGFVILHGTDTLAYTASALSFMLENLSKPVIITGSQIPIFEIRSDGQDNFQGALVIAGNYSIPEVAVYFNHKLYRGNRTTKVSTNDLNAFTSPNMPPLAKLGINIEVDWKSVFRISTSAKFSSHRNLNRNVGLLRLFPSISIEMIRAYLHPPMQGVVLQTYGAGNIPNVRKDLIEELQEASKRGVIIVNITQCLQGSVSSEYETGRRLLEVGVISGLDMTPEAALCKLSYVLSKEGWDLEMKRKMMQSNLRGEMTLPHQIKLKDLNLMTGLAKVMRLSPAKDTDSLRNVLFPSVMCAAVSAGDLQKLTLLQQYGGDINYCDVQGRTPLHIAAAEGKLEMVRYLLNHGAHLFAEDNRKLTPLDYAILNKQLTTVHILRNYGANLDKSSVVIGEVLCSAAASGDLATLNAYEAVGADLGSHDSCGRTALHHAVLNRQLHCIEYLLSSGVSPMMQDSLGFSAIDFADKLEFTDLKEKLKNNSLSVP